MPVVQNATFPRSGDLNIDSTSVLSPIDRWKCEAPRTSPLGNPVRCRKCLGCLRKRQWIWSRRAEREFEASARSWWVTLTHREGNSPSFREVQRALSRIRKVDREMRYLCTEEYGERLGRLHWHVLLHCQNAVTKKIIESVWPHGFTKARLAKSAALAKYMAKYQAKAGRLRASKHYGSVIIFPGIEFAGTPDAWSQLRKRQLILMAEKSAARKAHLTIRDLRSGRREYAEEFEELNDQGGEKIRRLIMDRKDDPLIGKSTARKLMIEAKQVS